MMKMLLILLREGLVIVIKSTLTVVECQEYFWSFARCLGSTRQILSRLLLPLNEETQKITLNVLPLVVLSKQLGVPRKCRESFEDQHQAD